MAREIVVIMLERSVEFEKDRFAVGEQFEGGNYAVVAIKRSIGGLADITSAGPGILGPNCPTIVVELEKRDGEISFLAIPERLVTSILFKNKKKKAEPEIQMTREE